MYSRIWQKYQSWWRGLSSQDQVIWFSLTLATLGGAFLRLAFFRGTLQYLADQGRDVIIAYGILQGDIALVGPSTSVGSMYLGPLYYYFMAPFLLLSGFDPIGPALAVALIGILTIPALYFVGSRLVGRKPALLAALLYASAPVVIEYTRFSWNPNPAPIVTLALLYFSWRAWRGSAWWWVGAAVALIVQSQLHYVALLSAAAPGLYWLGDLVRSLKSRSPRLKPLLLASATSVGLVLLAQLPLVAFNWRFNNTILNGFIDFFDGDPESGVAKLPFAQSLLKSIREMHGRSLMAFFEIWGAEWTSYYRRLNTTLMWSYLSVLLVGLRGYWRSQYRHGYLLLLLSVAATVIGLSWYRSSVFFHYLSYFFPIAYLVTGVVLVQVCRWFKWLGVMVAASLMGYIFWMSAKAENMRYLRPLGWQIDDVMRVSNRILAEIPADKSYGLAELSEVRDYRGLVYRYFLIKSDHPPVKPEDAPNADYLVVVAHSPREPDDVLSSPVYEIAVFPKNGYRIVEEESAWIYLIERESVIE